MSTPINFLREAIKAVPAVKYALGIGGIVAVIAIIYSFKIDPVIAVVGTIIMLLLMGVLVIFARVTALHASALSVPALIFTWFVLILFIGTSLCLFSSVFAKWPFDLQHWLVKPNQTSPTPTTAILNPNQTTSPSNPTPPQPQPAVEGSSVTSSPSPKSETRKKTQTAQEAELPSEEAEVVAASASRPALIDQTEVQLGISKSKLNEELKKIGSQCYWRLNSKNDPVCEFVNWIESMPANFFLVFNEDRLAQVEFLSTLSAGAKESGSRFNPKTTSSGDNSQIDKYCTKTFFNKNLSSFVSKFGAPLSAPKTSTRDLSNDFYKESCGSPFRSCQASKNVESAEYVFQVDSSVIALFSWNKTVASRYSENYQDTVSGADWTSCEYSAIYCWASGDKSILCKPR